MKPDLSERHFSPRTLAELWALSEDTIIRIFEDEAGVFKLGEQKRGKRAYTTLRIPETVTERVYRERGGK